jgi:ABC-type protease/lipase transport system fused ATPase/permease subunit
MRTARAKIVNGKIVTRAKFPEGTKLVLVVDEPKSPIVIDEEDEQAFDEAVVAVREGKTIPVEAVREILRRL